jgi:glycosyltransferase involved in cell wall biosynthesis
VPVARADLRISVVIPVRDDAERLERCREALHDQTRRADEIIVVDNGSSDLTPEVARWWNAVYVLERHPGIPAASAAGYDAATGDVIARLDADSVPPPDWVAGVEKVLGCADAPPAATGSGRFTSLGPHARRAAQRWYMDAYFRVFGRLLGHPPVFGSAFAMRRDAWRQARNQVHRRDPEVHDDLDLSFHLPDVRRDARLDAPISARPFADPLAFARRVRRGGAYGRG